MTDINTGTDPQAGTLPAEPTAAPAAPATPTETVSKAEFEKLKAERDEQYGRATRAEAKLKEQKPQGLSIDEKVDLRLEGYTKEDIAFLERSKGDRTLDEVKNDPHVKAALETIKKSREAEAKTPEPSTTVPTFTAEKKTWAQMTPDERKANFSSALQSIQKKSGSRSE